MFNDFLAFYLSSPARMKFAGRLLCGLSATLIIAGMALRVPVVATEMIQAMTKTQISNGTLASIYPSLPTWFIPETFWAYAVLMGVFGLGVYLYELARDIERIYFYR
ncbi:hypothetical protein RQP54_17505 [Curvibacter sp. APW13]|uniref:hypothetical protein n=1 Tax=Curvibacter sp. APW13 TaxID=3077236 RepID=UPI0028DDEFA2|nr:hypothetical protein [Curvibacter sp. APW13]MDT8992672.1 hypothetical protein [Curvibacter sp. APW13]